MMLTNILTNSVFKLNKGKAIWQHMQNKNCRTAPTVEISRIAATATAGTAIHTAVAGASRFR